MRVLIRAGPRSSRALLIALLAPCLAALGCSGHVLREEPYRQQVLDLVDARPGDRVVDVGCEDGFWSYEFARCVGPDGRVYALDIVEEWVEHVRRESEASGLVQVQPILCEPDDTTLDHESVDIIFFANTIHHLEDIPAYTRHLYGILEPGGKYVVVDAPEGRFGHSSDPGEIGRIADGAGFTVGAVTRFAEVNRYVAVFTKPVAASLAPSARGAGNLRQRVRAR